MTPEEIKWGNAWADNSNVVPRFVFVTNEDDWCGLYIDGKLVQEGHSLDWPRILTELFGVWNFKKITAIDCIENFGRCPKNLDEVWEDD